jgi:hypothetical protein
MAGGLLGRFAEKSRKILGKEGRVLAKGLQMCHSYKCADEISQESARKSQKALRRVEGAKEPLAAAKRESAGGGKFP